MRITALEAFGIDRAILETWAANGHEELLPIQVLAVRQGNVLDGGNAVIFSPTSSGKTFVGELAAVQTARRYRRALYLVPQKALAEEKYREFKAKYGPFGVRVVISTRDRKEHDRAIHRGEFHIAVIVFEKLQALLVASPTLLRNVGLTVIDEMQMVGDKTRGAGLEILLTKILLAEDRPQIIGLSAVLGNAQGLADWLGATLCEDWKRPVELRKGVLLDGKLRYREHNSGQEGTEILNGSANHDPGHDGPLAGVQRLAARGEQCLVFCRSRKESVQTAARLAKALGAPPASGALEDLSHLEDSQGKDILTGLLERGVAYHNADLDWDQRDVIERWFRQGEIAVVCATTTLALGINLPAKNVFIDPKRWDQDRTGRWTTVPISQAEYENASGRAGRLGLEDQFGRAILVAESQFEANALFDTFVKGDLGDVEPRLDEAPLAHHVLNLVASKLGRSKEEVRVILLSSYTGTLHWRGGEKETAFREKLDASIERCLAGELMIQGKEGLQATALGKLTATKGVTVDTAIDLAAFAKRNAEAAMAVHPFEVLWCLTGTESGEEVYFNLSTEEFRSGMYLELLERTLTALPRWVRSRMAVEQEGFAPTYEGTKRAKKALLLYDWGTGTPTRDVETCFHCYSGSIHGLAEQFAWLAETMAGVAKVLEWPDEAVERLATLSEQLLHGVPEAGTELAAARIRGLGRNRIAALVEAGLTTLERASAAPFEELRKLVTKPVAERLVQRAKEAAEAREVPGQTNAVDGVEPADGPTDTDETPEWSEQYPPVDEQGMAYRSGVAVHLDSSIQGNRYLVRLSGKEAWLRATSFALLLKLAVAAKATGPGWVGFSEIGRLDSYHQLIRRLKQDLAIDGVDPSALIENNGSKQYRLSVPPQLITLDITNITAQFRGGATILATAPSPPEG